MKTRAEISETPTLLVTVLRQFTRLMQDEVALAKAEFSRNLSRAGSGLALIGVAALLALTALDVLAGTLVAYLAATDLSVGTAALIVGGLLLLLAVGFAYWGKVRLRAGALDHDRTVKNVQADIESIREATNA